jgi:hypothetical protein
MTNHNSNEDTNFTDQPVSEIKRSRRLSRLDKRLAAQMYSLGVSQRQIALALNRDVRTIYKQIKSLDLIRGGAPDAIRERVSSFMDLLDPIAAVTHANCMVSGDVDIKSKHSLAHLKGKQYLTEQTQSIITTVSEDQLNKSLADTMVAALKATATDAEIQQTDSVQEIAQSNSVQAAPKKPYNNGHGKGRRAHRAVDYPRARKQHSNSAQVNGDSIEPRGDPTSVTGEG